MTCTHENFLYNTGKVNWSYQSRVILYCDRNLCWCAPSGVRVRSFEPAPRELRARKTPSKIKSKKTPKNAKDMHTVSIYINVELVTWCSRTVTLKSSGVYQHTKIPTCICPVSFYELALTFLTLFLPPFSLQNSSWTRLWSPYIPLATIQSHLNHVIVTCTMYKILIKLPTPRHNEKICNVGNVAFD